MHLFLASEIVIIPDTGDEKWRQKMESIYGTRFWSICHGYNTAKTQKTEKCLTALDVNLNVGTDATGFPCIILTHHTFSHLTDKSMYCNSALKLSAQTGLGPDCYVTISVQENGQFR